MVPCIKLATTSVPVSTSHFVMATSLLVSKVAVRKGDLVSAGTVVGITGNTGRSTGEHLHITCKQQGTCVNPIILIENIRQFT